MKTIIEMAREAGFSEWALQTPQDLEAFAALVRADERKRQERNFCPRCGKRTADPTTIHTCTPPVAAGSQAFYGFPDGPVSTLNASGKCVTDGETSPKEST